MILGFNWLEANDKESEMRMGELLDISRNLQAEILLGARALLFRQVYIKAGMMRFDLYLAKRFGISRHTARKYAHVAMVIGGYPRILQMLRKGSITKEHVSIIAAKITQANADVLLDAAPHSKVRDFRKFARSIDSHGNRIPPAAA